MKTMLSKKLINRYEREGVVFPIPVMTAAEAYKYRTAFAELEALAG